MTIAATVTAAYLLPQPFTHISGQEEAVDPVRIETAANYQAVGKARREIIARLAEAGLQLDAETADAVKLGLSEVLTNALLHGCGGEQPEDSSLRLVIEAVVVGRSGCASPCWTPTWLNCPASGGRPSWRPTAGACSSWSSSPTLTGTTPTPTGAGNGCGSSW